MLPKLQNMQQSPDFGLNMVLHESQRYRCWEEPLGKAKISAFKQIGHVMVEQCSW